MGFFSWKTADTQESISNIYADVPCRSVYLLQPKGAPAICEAAYEGYGKFSGKNAYALLGSWNADYCGLNATEESEEQLITLGVALDVGFVCRDVKTGKIWSVFHDYSKIVGGCSFKGTYAEPIPEYNASANDLIESGRFERVKISDLIEVKYPLKFSFDKDADYNKLPASERCPFQGYFFE